MYRPVPKIFASKEAEPTESRIVVRTRNTKTVLIDGNRLGMYDVPGSKAWLGVIRPRQEALSIPGPVTEDLIILVLAKENVTLKYSLGLKQRIPRQPDFSWDFIDWEKCSAGCGPREQVSKPRCIEKIGGLVDDKFCRNITEPVKSDHAIELPAYRGGSLANGKAARRGERRRAVKCVRPVSRGEQDLDVIEDSYCQGPKPREPASCEASRRRREDRDAADAGKRGLLSARSSTLMRQNDFIRAARVPAKTALTGANVKDRHPGDLATRTEQIGDLSDRSCLIGIGYVNALPNETTGLISADAIRNSAETRRDRSQIDKRSGNTPDDKQKMNANKIKKGEVAIDKEDIRNLTLTIILERDEKNVIMNFPMDFEPRPSENSTEFTLIGVDALRYVQRIQGETRASPEISIFRERRACDIRDEVDRWRE